MVIEVFIANTPPSVVEGKILDNFTLLTSSPVPSGEPITINYEIVPGTATPGEDYDYQSLTAIFDPATGIYTDSTTIPAGASISSFGINLLQDTFVEGTEFFDVNVTGVSGNAKVGKSSSVTVTVLDDDSITNLDGEEGGFVDPDTETHQNNQVTISAGSDAAEPATDGQFLVSLVEAAATETVVAYTVGGTATADADYEALTGSVTIPAGSLSAPVAVTALDDEYLEGSETVVVTLDTITAGDDNVVLSTVNTTTVTISDNVPTVLHRLNAGGPEIAAIDDGPNWLADTAFLTVPDSGRVFRSSALEVGLTLPPGTPGEIFNTERFHNINDVNHTKMQYAFNVNDGTYEVRLYMGNGFEGTSLPGQRIFDVAIEDQVLPNLDNIDLSANFGHLAGGVVSNEVVVTDGILNIEFLHDMLEGVQNPLINGIEIVQVSNDTTAPPTVSLVGEPTIVGEDGEFSQMTVLTSEPVPMGKSVDVSFEIVPGMATPQQDYIYESSTATFDLQTGIYADTISIPSGFSAESISVRILQDAIEEGSEGFTIDISDVDGANFEIGSAQSLSTTIVDDDSQLSPLRIEAEDTAFSTFQLEDLNAASGGQVLKFLGSEIGEGGISTLSLDTLTGFLPGEYDVVLSTFDMLFAGRQAATTFSVELNEDATIGEIVLRNPLESVSTTPGVSVERIVATQVLLGVGDTLTIKGFENPNEVFWLDYIQLNPVGISSLAQM